MDAFWKTVAGMLIAAVLWLTLDAQKKDMSLLLTLAVCVGAFGVLVLYLEPVLTFLHTLAAVGKLQEGMIRLLIKAIGIGLTGEIAAAICTDAGNAAMGKLMKLLTSGAILYLSIPLFQTLLSLVQEILRML